ncbi:MAG: M56 family metallopeptidase [Bacteroidaceae bacterium]|nr:M56 family metallopeptidase [Bacteroidaceae bacterium]
MNFAFLIKSALLLALLYGGFALLLSKETFHRFNRLALLTAMIASLVLPAIQIKAPSTLPLWGSAENAQKSAIELWDSFFETKESLTPNPSPKEEGSNLIAKSLTPTPIPSPRGEGSNIESESSTEDNITLPQRAIAKLKRLGSKATEGKGWEGALYLAGVFASVGFFLFQLFRFWLDTKGGTSTKDEEGNTIVIRGGEFPPYSFLHYIIISVSDYERLRKPILAHEQAHIRLGHSWDLLLLEVVKAIQWFNPFVYLLGRDLKAVHEYEADNAVLNQGIDAKTYQLLLVTKAVGNRLQTLGNNLSHHSLKKRIKMMHKTNSNRWMMTKAVVLPALMALAVVAFAKPKVEEIPTTEEITEPIVEESTTPPEVNTEVSLPADDDKIYDRVEENAQFPGGNMAMYKWIANHLQYPEECREKGIQGRVTMTFVVDTDGSIREIKALRSPDPLLSKEAIRVVNAMPKWKPAKDKGKVVRSHFRLPIVFKLPNTQKTVTSEPTEKPITETVEERVFVEYEENAQFPGGDEAMYKWIAEHIKYPEECKAKGIQGRVHLTFVIEKDGSVTNVKALRSPDDRLSQEAIRVVSAMPKWKPARYMNKAVSCNYRLPIAFKLPPAQTEQKPKE